MQCNYLRDSWLFAAIQTKSDAEMEINMEIVRFRFGFIQQFKKKKEKSNESREMRCRLHHIIFVVLFFGAIVTVNTIRCIRHNVMETLVLVANSKSIFSMHGDCVACAISQIVHRNYLSNELK